MKKSSNIIYLLTFKFLFVINLIFFICFLYLYKYSALKNKFDTNLKIKERLNLLDSLMKIFTELYDYIKDGYLRPKFSNKTINYSYELNNKNTCICLIVKNENLYIKEFVDYYFKLGTDKIFIYDNNDIEGENFDNILKDYIDNNFVEIIDVRGLSSLQIPIYNYCYRINRKNYNWIGFLDVDEYLYIENNQSIKNYFNKQIFNKCQTIFFNWVIFNDNNLTRYDNRKLIERFTNIASNSSEGKSFVRGNIDNLLIPTTHIPGININNFCNSNGELIYPTNFMTFKFEKKPRAYIKHYYTKTAEEFCNKISKNAHYHKSNPEFSRTIFMRLNYFFRLNKKTNEKLSILERCKNKILNNIK